MIYDAMELELKISCLLLMIFYLQRFLHYYHSNFLLFEDPQRTVVCKLIHTAQKNKKIFITPAATNIVLLIIV